MSNIRHVHDVLFLFQEVGGFENEDSLLKALQERFGDDVQFTSCSNKIFGLDGVVKFLAKRRKIVQNPDGSFSLHPEMTMCDGHHDHHHHHHNHHH